MLMWLVWKLLRRGKKKPAPPETPVEPASSPPAARRGTPEWEAVITESLVLNCIAPSEETILHAYDLFRDDLYGSAMERRHRMADLYADIVAGVGLLNALAPGLIERVMALHAFERTQADK